MLSPEKFISKIKPACEAFLRSSTRENLHRLRKEMEEVEDCTIDRFQSYILFPLTMRMDEIQERSSGVKLELIATIDYIINRVKIREKNAIKTILVISLKQVYDFESGHINESSSEDLKLAMISVLSSTLRRSSYDTLESFYTKENAGFIGKIAVACVELIDKERYKKLRIAAMECLMSAFYVYDAADFSDIVMRHAVANIVFAFLPKIISTLVLVATGDEIQGQQVIKTAIKTVGRILCLIFEDYNKDQNETELQANDFLQLVKAASTSGEDSSPSQSDDEVLAMNLQSKPMEERLKTLQTLERSNAWLGASSRKLRKTLRGMDRIRASSSNQVREEFATMCCTLIEKCYKHLNANFNIFLENVFALSQDEDQRIRAICVDFLGRVNEDPVLSPILSASVDELLQMHLVKLPRVINRWDDTEQLTEFLFWKGLVDNTSDDILAAAFTVDKKCKQFCDCLFQALELKLDNELLKEEYAIRDVEEDINEVKPFYWRRFEKINDERVIALIKDIVSVLGQMPKVGSMLINHLWKILEHDLPDINEVILIYVFLLNDFLPYDPHLENHIFTLQELLEERRWNLELRANEMPRLPLKNNTCWYVERTPGLYESAVEIRTQDVSDRDYDGDVDDDDFVNIVNAQFNVLHTCLLLDAIGHLTSLVKYGLYDNLPRSVHRILEKASSSNFMVHEAAMYALKCIAKGLNLESIPAVIREFRNFITYFTNLALKKKDDNKTAFDILSTVLRYGTFESISYLENVIITIIEEASRKHLATKYESFLKVFHMFLVNLGKWIKKLKKNESMKFVSENEESWQQMEEQIDLYDQWVEILNKQFDEYDDPTGSEEYDSDTPLNKIRREGEAPYDIEEQEQLVSTKTLPKHIEIVTKILKQVLKSISSKNHMQKIISLDCLVAGLPLLKDYEDELLPICHLIWQPFVQKFKEKNANVLSRCLTLLQVLAIHAKDFLLSRTTKDVLPVLTDFLRESSKNTLSKAFISRTQEFKLQVKLLREYPIVIVNMNINEKEVDRISEAVLLYMNKNQPKQLQKAAIDYFQEVSSYNCPAVYIKMLAHESDADKKVNVRKVLDFIMRK